jgi:hypothetical protein
VSVSFGSLNALGLMPEKLVKIVMVYIRLCMKASALAQKLNERFTLLSGHKTLLPGY